MKILDNNVYKILEDFYLLHIDEIQTIFITGSFCCPYISNPQDIDYVVVWKTEQDRHNNISNILALQQEVKAININYNGLNRYTDWYYNVCSIHHKMPLYFYLLKYIQILFGEGSNIQNIDILQNKEFLIPALVSAIEAAHHQKWFYHLLIDLYILNNQSYELTTEQQNNAQLVHDQYDQNIIEPLYQWAVEQINEYKKDSE